MSVFEISFSFSSEFSLPFTLVLSLKFSVLSVLRGSFFPKTFVCFVSLSLFEISFSFSLEFSLSSSLVLSPTFFVLSVLRGFYSPKRLSVLNQNLCFFVCIWNFFQFFLQVFTIILFGIVTNIFEMFFHFFLGVVNIIFSIVCFIDISDCHNFWSLKFTYPFSL